MPRPHPRPWHRGSVFGDGPRRPLDREHRARFRFLARAHRGAGRLTANDVDVAEVLVSALGDDGRLDLAHATIAARALCHVATVKRALRRLREVGLVDWVRRLVRGPGTGWRCEQGSNAYVLRTPGVVGQSDGIPCEAHAARPVKPLRFRKASDEDTAARESAARQIRALGFPIPAGWDEGRLLTRGGDRQASVT
jgi:hypothetical protein